MFQGCVTTNSYKVRTTSITVYEEHSIPANTGISTGVYTNVSGYRYVYVAVEFEQLSAAEEPVSLGVKFAHSQDGKWGSQRYFTFDENISGSAAPQMITVSGEASWHGHPHDKSSYIARLPIMGPYLQVFPFNHHSQERKISIVLYLTE